MRGLSSLQQIRMQRGELGEESSIFLEYISRNISALEEKSAKLKKKHSPSHKIEEEIEFYSRMRDHYYTSLKQYITNGAAPDPQLDTLLMPVSSKSFATLATVLVFGALTNYQTCLKHQMVSLNEVMYKEFQKIKSQVFNPLIGLQYNEEITLQETIKKTEISLNKIVDNYPLVQYIQSLDTIKNKPLSVLREEIVIEENEEEQIQQEKSQVLQVTNSSSESQKPTQNVIPNYQGDQEVFTGDSDHNIHEKKLIKKYAKKKKNNKKYVEEENYEASQEEDKHKKNRHLAWRYHHTEQGFDTDKEKK